MTEPGSLPRVMTPKMLSEIWLCSEKHVRNLIKSGQLKSFKLGVKLARIRTEDVEEFEREHTMGSSQPGITVPALPAQERSKVRAARPDRPGLAPAGFKRR